MDKRFADDATKPFVDPLADMRLNHIKKIAIQITVIIAFLGIFVLIFLWKKFCVPGQLCCKLKCATNYIRGIPNDEGEYYAYDYSEADTEVRSEYGYTDAYSISTGVSEVESIQTAEGEEEVDAEAVVVSDEEEADSEVESAPLLPRTATRRAESLLLPAHRRVEPMPHPDRMSDPLLPLAGWRDSRTTFLHGASSSALDRMKTADRRMSSDDFRERRPSLHTQMSDLSSQLGVLKGLPPAQTQASDTEWRAGVEKAESGRQMEISDFESQLREKKVQWMDALAGARFTTPDIEELGVKKILNWSTTELRQELKKLQQLSRSDEVRQFVEEHLLTLNDNELREQFKGLLGTSSVPNLASALSLQTMASSEQQVEQPPWQIPDTEEDASYPAEKVPCQFPVPVVCYPVMATEQPHISRRPYEQEKKKEAHFGYRKFFSQTKKNPDSVVQGSKPAHTDYFLHMPRTALTTVQPRRYVGGRCVNKSAPELRRKTCRGLSGSKMASTPDLKGLKPCRQPRQLKIDFARANPFRQSEVVSDAGDLRRDSDRSLSTIQSVSNSSQESGLQENCFPQSLIKHQFLDASSDGQTDVGDDAESGGSSTSVLLDTPRFAADPERRDSTADSQTSLGSIHSTSLIKQSISSVEKEMSADEISEDTKTMTPFLEAARTKLHSQGSGDAISNESQSKSDMDCSESGSELSVTDPALSSPRT